ncbi:hypothetical protein KAM338_34460 [Aeromonas caviae]|nr:hypothetical protein KAM330_23690 [Aeromonas hydrophila]BCO13613.1 hypothetical protein RIMD111065_19690 [Aeromonas hydrophila]BDC82289.1 hypothetical protein NUITMVA1_22320 [Aeromonas hydrophila]GKQ63269.1 hypothetical protein KAM338_34460 [Aeromonas caviae]CAD7537402.1 hypothetical protein KBAH04_22540 [Aeromonas hydrophila]
MKLTYWLRLLTAAKQRPATIIQTAPAKGECLREGVMGSGTLKKVRRIITAIVCSAKPWRGGGAVAGERVS